MKGIFKFLIIAIVAILGLSMIGVLYLFFFPNAKLFGIEYISLNNVYYSNAYDSKTIDTINISTRSYEVRVIPVDMDKISTKVYSNSIGFVKSKNSKVEISGEIKNGVLNLNVAEPHGWTWKHDSYVEIYIPKNKSFDITLNNKGAKTFISDANVKANKFNYNTSSGNLYLSNLTINGDISLNLNKAKCYMEDNVKLNKNNIDLSFSSGDLIAEAMSFNKVSIIKNKSGTINIKSCASMSSQVNAGGRYTIGTVDDINIVSTDSNIEIGTLNNSCSITLKESGKVNITNLNCFANIETTTGDIHISNSNEKVSLKSSEGDIKIDSATKKVLATNKYGHITVSFKDSIGSYEETNEYRAIIAKNYNGKVTVEGVENIIIEISNKGRANVNMKNVIGQNKITGALGDISVVVDENAIFNLSAGGTTGGIIVNFKGTTASGGYNEKNLPNLVKINGGSLDNSLTVQSTKGDIKIIDTVIAGQK